MILFYKNHLLFPWNENEKLGPYLVPIPSNARKSLHESGAVHCAEGGGTGMQGIAVVKSFKTRKLDMKFKISYVQI